MKIFIIILTLFLSINHVLAQNQTGIVYATKSGILRRIIVPTNDKELSDPKHVSNGETLFIVQRDELKTYDDIVIKLQEKIGKLIPSSRCIAIDITNIVTDILSCDPEIDSLPNKILMLDEKAEKGWLYSPVDKTLTEVIKP